MANENKNRSNETGQSDKNQPPVGKKEEIAKEKSGPRAGWTAAIIAIVLLILVIIGGGILGYTYVEKTKKQYTEMSQDILKNITPVSDSSTSGNNSPSALIEEGAGDSSTSNGTQSLAEIESDGEAEITESEKKEKVGSYNFDKKISELDQKVNASNEDFFQSDDYNESEMGL